MEEKAFYRTGELAKEFDVQPQTLRIWCIRLGIQRHHFEGVRGIWYAASDVAKLRQYREQPWLALEQSVEKVAV